MTSACHNCQRNLSAIALPPSHPLTNFWQNTELTTSFYFQVNAAETESDLRAILDDVDDAALLLETGYRTPLACLKLTHKASLCQSIREYYAIIRVLPEVNQFAEGLDTLNVLNMIKNYPTLMKPLFVDVCRKKFDKG